MELPPHPDSPNLLQRMRGGLLQKGKRLKREHILFTTKAQIPTPNGPDPFHSIAVQRKIPGKSQATNAIRANSDTPCRM